MMECLLKITVLLLVCHAVVSNGDGPLLDDTPPTKPSPDTGDSLPSNTDSYPMFLVEPSDTFVIKNKPATLHCRAANSLQLYFKCNGVKNIQTFQSEFVDPQSGIRIVDAECNVTRNMVEEFFGKDKFKCECHAWSGRGHIKSQAATIEVAYLKKQFELAPVSTRVELGQQTELRCVPPEGLPPPRVYWQRGAVPLLADTAVLVTSEGHLLLGQARERDTGNYTCVAENLAARRNAPPAQIVVYVNGGWSQWSAWTDCKCPGSNNVSGQKRTRTCTSPPPSNGGLTCQGSNVHRTSDCLPCPPVEPRWSAWSEWSECGTDCTRSRRRHCIITPPGPGQPQPSRACTGKDAQTSPCSVDHCQPTADVREEPALIMAHYYDNNELGDMLLVFGECLQHAAEVGVEAIVKTVRFEATLADTQTDLALYIGLSVAVTLVTVLSFFLVRVYYRKGQHQSLYNMAANEYHPEFFPEHDKKSLSLQPDLTQTVPPCYEYPYTKPVTTTVTRSVSEHHYDVPHLASASDIQMSPATSSTLESSSGKRSQLSGFTNGSDSTYEVATESVTLPLPALPTAYAVTPTTNGNYTNALISHTGGYLHLPDNGVSLLIPEGSIGRGRKHDIFLSILNEDCFRPKLNDNLTQLSPVVSCGPNITLNKPVILRAPHCADLKRNDWSISVLMSDCSDAQWQSVVTLGQETINTPVFCQLDTDTAYLITDSLSRFVLVGQSLNGNASKRLKLAVFAPKLCFQSSVDYSVRVYVLEDTESSMETVFSQEKRLGGLLMDEPKSIVFQDGGNNLCLTLDNISDGWKAKPSSNYQEIPFRHLWQATSNTMHCSFTLEAYEISHNLNFIIRVNQYGSENVQTFEISVRDQDMTPASSSRSPKNSVTQKYSVPNESSSSKNYKNCPPEEFNSPKSAKSFKTFTQEDFPSNGKSGKSLILTDKGVSTCEDFVFRLNKQVRKQLCQCLDPPTARGNDWRMLAHALSVDRYINYFATKPSPTDCILDLWEARHRQSNAMTDLIQIFRDMDRYDGVSILDNCLGPNWL